MLILPWFFLAGNNSNFCRPSLSSGHLIRHHDSKVSFLTVLVLCDVRFIVLVFLPLMNVCLKPFYFVWFSPTNNFLGIDPTHTVYSLPPSWTQRERSASAHTVQFDQTTRRWAKVCLHLCGMGQAGTFFSVRAAEQIEITYYWVVLNKFCLSWYFAYVALTNLCQVQDFPFSCLYFLVTEV